MPATGHGPRPCVWTADGSGVVELDRVDGPARGPVELPDHLLPGHETRRYDATERHQRIGLYETVLAHGTAEDIYRTVNLAALAEILHELRLPAFLTGPWCRALREAGYQLDTHAAPRR